MTAWHLPLALSGQTASLGTPGNVTLTFAPRQPCPFQLPMLLVARLGTISCRSGAAGAADTFVLELLAGDALELDVLAVNGHAYPSPASVTLVVGTPLSWMAQR